jgi:TRAP-type C4-dicarboxylate transport system permease small subunit
MKVLASTSEAFIRLTHNLGAVLLAVAFVLVFYQVLTRFVLGDAAAWSEILARAVIIWTVFLVSGAAIRLGKMIPIDAVRNMFPPGVQIWIIRLVTIATLLVLGVLIWFGTKMTMHVASQQVAMLNISVSWFYAALPIGSAFAIPGVLLAAADSERAFRNKGMLEPHLDEGDTE